MSYDSHYQSYLKKNQSVIDAQKKNLEEQAEANRNLINTSADKRIDDINSSYEDEIQSANESAENAHQKNEVQRLLNERHLERKAAEIGLTDSGINRTQLTANQLSYGNQKSEIDNQRQKAVSTLAAAMASKVSDINIERDSKLLEVDTGLNSAKAQVDASLASQADEYAREMYKADLENAAKYVYVYDDEGNVTGKYKPEDRTAAWNNLVAAFDSGVADPNKAASLIRNFDLKYTLTEAEEIRILNKSGLTETDLENYYAIGVKDEDRTVYVSANEKTYASNPKRIAKDEWKYEDAGTQEYEIILKENTFNWWGGEDNDKVDIIAPNGDIVKSDVEISELNIPYADRKAISTQFNEKPKGTSITYSVNLNAGRS